jgi:hypothetical protein
VLRQNGKLPLHYAVEKGATLEVVKLLLGGQGNATTATAEDKVRRCANTTLLAVPHLDTTVAPCASSRAPCMALLGCDIAKALLRAPFHVYRKGSYRCTTPLRRARRWR